MFNTDYDSVTNKIGVLDAVAQMGVSPVFNIFARRVASEFCILDKGRRVAAGLIGELTDQVVQAHLSV